MKKYYYPIFFVLLIFSACAKDSLSGKEKKPNMVTIAVQSDMRSLDPRISTQSPSLHMIEMMYEGLMRFGPNGEIVPGMAESISVSEDQKTYTFQLRKAYWTNGDPVTAYDFEHAWKKSVDPYSATIGGFNFYIIKNVEPCLKKQVGVDKVGIWALDKRTLQVELEHPAPYFLGFCAMSSYAPIHKRFDLSDSNWASHLNPHFVTNGPFRMKKWKKGVEICMKKNPNYWDKTSVKLDGIRIQILSDSYNQFLLFQKGKLDWIGCPFNNLPPDLLESTFKNGELEVIDMYGATILYLNTQKPPFNNKNFRKAIAYAIDRNSLVTHILQLGHKPAMSLLNGEMAVSDHPYFEDGNVDLAKHHLSLALDEMGKTLQDIGTITLSQRDCPLTSRVIQAIQEQLYVNLGLSVIINQSEWNVHFNRVSKGDYEMTTMDWASLLNDPIYNLNPYRSRDLAVNISGWEHPTYQEILKKCDNELDPKKRKEYLYQAEEFLMKEMPVIPICFNKLYFLSNNQLKGVYLSPLRTINFRYAYFES